MGSSAAVYCADTSAFARLRQWYPPRTFPSLWPQLERLITAGRLISPHEVLRELGKIDDDLYKWAKKHIQMFVDLDLEQQALVREILAAFPAWVDPTGENPQADPFVVALGRTRSLLDQGQRYVVTHETPAHPGSTKIKIPNVCQHYSIPYIGIVELFTKEGWKF